MINLDTDEGEDLSLIFPVEDRSDYAAIAAAVTGECDVPADVLEGLMQAMEGEGDDISMVDTPLEEVYSSHFYEEEGGGAKCDDDDNDFFAENQENCELPDHMKDQYLENFDKEMDEHMTLQEFEKSQFQVHGISQAAREDTEMVNKALHDLDVEINRLKKTDVKFTELYRIAELQSQAFVQNRSFRLLFLRCESFDIKNAARRMMKHFQQKDWIWGRDKLAKTITLADLDENDMECLKHGHAQLLPIRDHAGRSVFFNNLNHLHYQDGLNQLRAVWYLVMVAAGDEDTQKNGLVVIQYKVGEHNGHRPNRQLLWKGAFAISGIPATFGAFHLCFGRQSLPFVRLFKLALEYQTSHRVRVHEGSQTEVLQQLMAFGIPRYAVPISATGQITTSYHLDWLGKRSNMEQEITAKEKDVMYSSESVTSVVVPGNADILLGRGKRAQLHPGNIRYGMLLEEGIAEFDAGNRKGKNDVAVRIMDHIKGTGGRFLKRVEKTGSWEVVSQKVVREKIAHDFRTLRKRRTGQGLSSSVQSCNKKRIADVSLSSNRQHYMESHET